MRLVPSQTSTAIKVMVDVGVFQRVFLFCFIDEGGGNDGNGRDNEGPFDADFADTAEDE